MHLTRAAVLDVLRSLDTPLLPNADDAIPKTELWWLRPVRQQFVHEQARFSLRTRTLVTQAYRTNSRQRRQPSDAPPCPPHCRVGC